MAVRFNPPETFNFGNPTEWTDWKQRFLRFRLATKLPKEDPEVQISTLIYVMGREAEHIFKSFVFAENDDSKKFYPVLQKFEYFVPKRNVIHERAKFHRCSQNPGENVESFVRNLYEIAEHCAFKDKDDQIRDRIVLGILDRELSEKLQLTADLKLEDAIERARQLEMVKLQMKDQTVSHKHVEKVHRGHVNSGHSQNRHRRGPNKGKGQKYYGADQEKFGRTRCGKCNSHHSKDTVSPEESNVVDVMSTTIFAVCCHRTRAEIQQPEQTKSTRTRTDSLYLDSVTECHDDEDAWNVNLKISDSIVTFKIDTGADTSVISEKTYLRLKNPGKLDRPDSLFGPSGKIQSTGKFTVQTIHKGKPFLFPVHVIEGNSNLLSRSTAYNMGLIQKLESVETTIPVYGSFGLVNCDPVMITLRPDAKPYCLTTARRVAFPLLPKVEAALQQLEHEGIIQKIERPIYIIIRFEIRNACK